MMRKVLGLFTAVAAAVLVFASPVSAQQYPPQSTGGLAVSATSVAAGDEVTVRGEGFAPASNVTVTLHSDPVLLGEFTADPSGAVDATVLIPSSTPAGLHTLVMEGVSSEGEQMVLAASVTVTGDADSGADQGTDVALGDGSTTGEELPRTGSSTSKLAVLAAGAVLVGAVLTFVSRRRSVSV